MAWEELLPNPAGGGTYRSARVTVSRRVEKSGVPRLFIGLTGPMLEALGWQRDAMLKVEIDRAAGELRMSPSGLWKLNSTKNGNKGGTISIPFARPPGRSLHAGARIGDRVDDPVGLLPRQSAVPGCLCCRLRTGHPLALGCGPVGQGDDERAAGLDRVPDEGGGLLVPRPGEGRPA